MWLIHLFSISFWTTTVVNGTDIEAKLDSGFTDFATGRKGTHI